MEAAEEVEERERAKKQANRDLGSGRGGASMDDILMQAADEVDQQYEDEGFESNDESAIPKGNVKDILRKSAQEVDNEARDDAREVLTDAAKSLRKTVDPGYVEQVAQPEKHKYDPDSDDDIVSKLHRASEKVAKKHDIPSPTDESDDDSVESECSDTGKEYENNSAFLISCYRRNIDSVEQHLRRGANPLYRDRHGWTAAHWAAAKGHEEILDLLIREYKGRKSSKLVNAKDSLVGWTPLHLACVGGHIDCVRLLLDRGAKKTSRNSLGETPADCISSSTRTAEGRRLAKLLGVWSSSSERGDESKRK